MKKMDDPSVNWAKVCAGCFNAEDCKYGAMCLPKDEFLKWQAIFPKLQEIPCSALAFCFSIGIFE